MLDVWERLSLRWKLFLTSVCAYVVIAAGVLSLGYMHQRDMADADLRSRAEIQARLLADASSIALLLGRNDLLQLLSKDVISDGDVKSSLVVGPSGELLVDMNGSSGGSLADDSLVQRAVATTQSITELQNGSVRAAYPILMHAQYYGSVIVTLSTESIDARIRSNLMDLGLLMILGLLGFCFLAIVSSSRILSPLHDLVLGARRAAKGDLSHNVRVRSKDEIGLLMISFNAMQTSLRERIDEVAKLYLSEKSRADEVSTLLQSTHDLASELEPASVLKHLVQRAVSLTQAKSGFAAIVEGDEVVSREMWRMGEWVPWARSWRVKDRVETLFHDGEPIVSNDRGDACSQLPCLEGVSVVQSIISAPILGRQNEFLGVIVVSNKQGAAGFVEHEAELLKGLSHQAALALENARLYSTAVAEKAMALTIIQSSVDGIMVCNYDRVVIATNPAMEKLTGYDGESLLGCRCKGLLDALDSGGRPLCDTYCPFDSEGGFETLEVTIGREGGARLWVELSCGKIHDDGGKLVGVVHIMRDVAQRKEAEQLKDDYISIAAHDLRTPVTAIKGYSQLIKRWLARNETGRLQEGLDTIEAQSNHLAHLLESLLDVSRIQAGQLQLLRGRVNLLDIIKDVVAEFESTAENHHLAFEMDGDAWGNWDRSRIEQVLNNLIGNAIKYSPEGGEVWVRAGRDEDEVRVHVSDQGIGISQQDLEKVFERHYRLDKAAELGLQGNGLGLYIVKGIIEAHGGRVWVDSEINKGSTFSFALPLDGFREDVTTD